MASTPSLCSWTSAIPGVPQNLWRLHRARCGGAVSDQRANWSCPDQGSEPPTSIEHDPIRVTLCRRTVTCQILGDRFDSAGSMMRIGMVLPTQYPPDIRVEKEAHALSAEHEVHLLCPRRGSQIPREQCGPVQVRRIFSDTQRQFANLQLMTTCTSYQWLHEIRQFVREHRIDALHVHDLPLVGPAITIAREHNIPVVADLHENYPQMIAAAKSTTQR